MTPKILFAPPPEKLELTDDEIHVFCAALDQPAAQLERWTKILSADERDRASRFIFERDQNRFVAGRGQLREILGWLLRVAPEQITFTYGEHGKPRLAAPIGGKFLHFNLAHSDTLAVYAISREHELGVDVERIRTLPEAEQIAANYFSAREREHWNSLPDEKKADTFFNFWTRKEALVKAMGRSLAAPLNQIEILPQPQQPAVHKFANYFFHSFTPAADYAGAVAIKTAAGLCCWKWR